MTVAAACAWGCAATDATWHGEPSPGAASTQAAALHERAVDLLQQAVRSSDALLRANAIEALEASPANLEGAVRMGLVDPNRGVRFVAAMAVGRQRLTSIVHLTEPLIRDSSESVRAAAMYAQHACGRSVDLTPLAAMLESGSAEVRGNAAIVLGELGNPSAVALIRQAVGRPMPRENAARHKIVDLQLAEALVRLGEEEEVEAIRAALLLPGDQNEVTALAAQIAGKLRDEGSRGFLTGMLDPANTKRRPPEVHLAAAAALAQLGNPPAMAAEVVRSSLRDANPFIRAQAAISAGYFGGAGVAEELEPLLGDEHPLVQISAARGILEMTGRVRG
jgi:HEAT repeat protein